MPHPYYGPPNHSLETLSITVDLPSDQNDHRTCIRVDGVSGGKRRPLFTTREEWGPDEIQRGMQASTWLGHVLLAFLQDRPNCPQQAENALRGEPSEQGTLPL